MLLSAKLCSTLPLPFRLPFGIRAVFVIASVIMPELLIELTSASAVISRLLHSLRDHENHCGEDGKDDGHIKQGRRV